MLKTPLKLTAHEIDTINAAIIGLNSAKEAETEEDFLKYARTGYKCSRQVIRGRLD